jgi:hypothetical protein
LGESKKNSKPFSIKDTALNLIIAVLFILVIYLCYSFFVRTFINPPVDYKSNDKIIQLDVLNGCGTSGVAVKFTEFLRARGFDVLEMGNYKSFDVQETLIVDRVGNIDNAYKVAHALGVDEKNVIQQISHDSYLDCSVVIGKDYTSLKPMR